jgi:predicted RNA-binding Zn-ribbon protein involved in translation (DUF1610 family)
MKLTRAQQSRHEAAVGFRVVDPVTGVRHCRWCMTATTEEGEYQCPQCGRWQHERAFPSGVPGVSQVEYRCTTPGCPTAEARNVLAFGHDAVDPQCPNCGEPVEEVP